MADFDILNDTTVTNKAGEKFQETGDELGTRYRRIQDVDYDLIKSWEGKAGDYFEAMANVVETSLKNSKIFSDKSAIMAFNIAKRFVEIDEKSNNIITDLNLPTGGIIDGNRNVILDGTNLNGTGFAAGMGGGYMTATGTIEVIRDSDKSAAKATKEKYSNVWNKGKSKSKKSVKKNAAKAVKEISASMSADTAMHVVAEADLGQLGIGGVVSENCFIGDLVGVSDIVTKLG